MESVDIGRLFLDLRNPRHEPYGSEAEVIEYLCRYEDVLPLAKDIAAIGINPLELLAVIPEEGTAARGRSRTYFAAEGNRRLCALKLLDDPDRAPTKLRSQFQALADEWDAVSQIPCVVFSDRDAVRVWLSRIHEGQQGGIGRKSWSADQSARHSGGNRNKLALWLLDYAEEVGLISAEGRKGKLTTAQRYLGSIALQDALGIDAKDLDNIRITRPKSDFDKLVGKFTDDLQSGYVNSRMNREHHDAYAREMGAVSGITGKRENPHKPEAVKPKAADKPAKPPKRKGPRNIPFEDEIYAKLDELGGDKLPSLYHSICTVPLETHTPLLAIGVWAFLESLSARAGRGTGTDFPSFFSKNRLAAYGLDSGKGSKAILQALQHVSTSGDVTKHDATAAHYNAAQLVNDMETLKNLILACADEAIKK